MAEAPVKEEIHWTFTAQAAPERKQLDGSLTVDVLVVGGGLTGCRTALGLAEAGTSVALVDSNGIGWGSSGRSGGQCNPIDGKADLARPECTDRVADVTRWHDKARVAFELTTVADRRDRVVRHLRQ